MDFYKRMGLVMERIPFGRAASYGQIALLCGMPRNARQVGYGLRRELAGKDVPAHRVVNSRGLLSGASAFALPDLQKRLLEAEGIELLETPEGWRVELERFGWHNTLSEAEELLREFEEWGI